MRRLSPAERQAILSTLPPTKVCPQCGIEKKSIDCLLSRRVRKDGPHYDLSHCLACHRAGMADYRADPRVREKELARGRAYRARPAVQASEKERMRRNRLRYTQTQNAKRRAVTRAWRRSIIPHIADALLRVYDVSRYEDIPYPAEARAVHVWILHQDARCTVVEIARLLGMERTIPHHYIEQFRKVQNTDGEVRWTLRETRRLLGRPHWNTRRLLHDIPRAARAARFYDKSVRRYALPENDEKVVHHAAS
jgi:hypothetical protein